MVFRRTIKVDQQTRLFEKNQKLLDSYAKEDSDIICGLPNMPDLQRKRKRDFNGHGQRKNYNHSRNKRRKY